MYLTRSEYDRGVNTFSPEGRLFQVEYAIEAIKLGSTAIGLQTKYGCVLAVEKRLTSSLLEPKSVEKIAEIDCHIGAAMSGLVADARTLVDHARVEAQNHRFTYDEPIGVEALTQGKLRLFYCYCLPVCSCCFHCLISACSLGFSRIIGLYQYSFISHLCNFLCLLPSAIILFSPSNLSIFIARSQCSQINYIHALNSIIIHITTHTRSMRSSPLLRGRFRRRQGQTHVPSIRCSTPHRWI